MWRTIYTLHDHFKGYLTSHDSSMVTICCSLTERIYDIFVIFFSQSSKQVHKVIIGKEVIWSSYNIHFVSLHHKYHHHHHHLSIILCNNQLKVSTSPKQPISSRVQVLYHWIWRCLTLDTLTSVSIFSILYPILWYSRGEICITGDHSLYSHDPNVWFGDITVRRD